MTRLVQLERGDLRRVALVEEPHLRLLDGCSSIYELANSAISTSPSRRRPHSLFGTDGLSFSDGIKLQDGDLMQVSIEGFGRPLRNLVRVAGSRSQLISVKALG
jgi:hypothetical protein